MTVVDDYVVLIPRLSDSCFGGDSYAPGKIKRNTGMLFREEQRKAFGTVCLAPAA